VNTLNKQQIATLATSLQQQRQRLIAAIRAHLHQSDQPGERALLSSFDEHDGPSAALIGELGIAQLRHECEELQDIDAALQRIDAGNYGTCLQCGVPIPFERMSVQPVAKACLACQKKAEQSYGAWSHN
jgi:DnaK suppressor protein